MLKAALHTHWAIGARTETARLTEPGAEARRYEKSLKLLLSRVEAHLGMLPEDVEHAVWDLHLGAFVAGMTLEGRSLCDAPRDFYVQQVLQAVERAQEVLRKQRAARARKNFCLAETVIRPAPVPAQEVSA